MTVDHKIIEMELKLREQLHHSFEETIVDLQKEMNELEFRQTRTIAKRDAEELQITRLRALLNS